MILNPFHGTGLFLCPVKWVKDNFNKYVSEIMISVLVP